MTVLPKLYRMCFSCEYWEGKRKLANSSKHWVDVEDTSRCERCSKSFSGSSKKAMDSCSNYKEWSELKD